MTPNVINYHFLHDARIYASSDLRIRVESCHELLGQLYFIPEHGSRENLITFELVEPEHVTLEDPVCHTYVCSFVAQFLLGHIITKSLPVVY